MGKACLQGELLSKENTFSLITSLWVCIVSRFLKLQITVSSPYLKVIVYPKLLIFQSKFSGFRKFTLNYHKFEKKRPDMKIKIGHVPKL